jgi:hypothetical protein
MRLTMFSTPARTVAVRIALLVAVAAFSRGAGAQATSAADSTAVVAAVDRLFDAMAHRDTTAARAVLMPGSQLISIRPGAEPAAPRRQADSTFLRSLAGGGPRLLERMWTPAVLVHGAIAVVWAPYDFHIDGKFSHCGVDTFGLVRTATGWQISGISYTVEQTGCAPSPLGPPR